MLIKNIEAKVRLATFVAAGSLVTALLMDIAGWAYAFKLVSNSQRSIYRGQ